MWAVPTYPRITELFIVIAVRSWNPVLIMIDPCRNNGFRLHYEILWAQVHEGSKKKDI
jgi:hypothetical protein